MATEKSIVISAEVKRGEIINNFAAIKAQVAAKVAPYMGLVFGDENIKDAKSTVAELRKMRTAIEDKRRAIKKQWNEPYTAFEDEVRQITAIIDEPIEEIDTQIKSFEERRKLEKRDECDAVVDSLVDAIEQAGDRAFVKACGIVFDERWLNATTAISQVEKDVSAQIDKILTDAKTITEVCEGDDLLTELLVEYQSSRDLPTVLLKRKRMVEQHEAAERLAALRKSESDAKKAVDDLNNTALETTTIVSADMAEARYQPRSVRMAFVLEGPLDQLKAALSYVRSTDGITVARLYRHGTHQNEFWNDHEKED